MGRSIILILTLTINISAQNISENKTPLNLPKFSFQNSKQDPLPANSRTHHSGINIGGQVIVGGAMGLVTAFIPFGAAFAASFSESTDESTAYFWTAVAISAYAFGTATGVHWIAKIENKNHSFWKTVMYSELGALIATGFAVVIIPDKKGNSFSSKQGGILILLMPMVSSLIYSLNIADWPQQIVETTKYERFKLNINIRSFKDLVDQTQIIKINILRINL